VSSTVKFLIKLHRRLKTALNKLTDKSDNKIKITCSIIKQETGKICITEQMPSLLIGEEKIKAPEKVDVFNTYLLSFNC
jgi:hypothetical protein